MTRNIEPLLGSSYGADDRFSYIPKFLSFSPAPVRPFFDLHAYGLLPNLGHIRIRDHLLL
jgi:hypothetical protein